MKCIDLQNICALRGQAFDIEVTVLNDDGTDAILSGATLEFGLAGRPSAAYILQKTPTAANNVITARIVESDYDSLPAKQYYFSFWVTIEGSPTPVARGHMEIQNDSRSVT